MLKRHEVQVLRRAGHTWKEIAALSGVSVRTVRRIAAESHITTVDNAAERARHDHAVRQQISAWRDRRIRLRSSRPLGEIPLRARAEVSQEHVAVSEPIRGIGERSEVLRGRQIAERKRATRHPAQRTVRDATHGFQ